MAVRHPGFQTGLRERMFKKNSPDLQTYKKQRVYDDIRNGVPSGMSHRMFKNTDLTELKNRTSMWPRNVWMDDFYD